MMYRIPQSIARLLQPWVTLAITHGRKTGVYLTFDDGPDEVLTPRLLDLLSEFDARASFFPVGEQSELNPGLIHRIREAGHSVHLHSWSHKRLQIHSLREFIKDVGMCRALIGSNTYRPPYGRIPLPHLFWLMKHGFRAMMWNVDFRDYRPGMAPENQIVRFIGRIRPGDIILLHNNPKFSEKTMVVTRLVLEHLSAKCYTFERIR